jgi:hypothetical protein
MKKFTERFIGFWMGVGITLLLLSIQFYYYNRDYGQALTPNYPISLGVIGILSLVVAELAINKNKQVET